MTALRQRMIEDMQLRNLGTETQRAYVHYIRGLARFYQTSPDQLGLEEIREYQLYMINDRRYSPESVNTFVSAVRFLYTVTLETPWPEGALPRCRVPHRLPVVLSATEVHEFFQHVCTIRYRAALMTAYGAGLRVSEVAALRIGDIDSKRMFTGCGKAKARRIATPCSLHGCWKCCAAGGGRAMAVASRGTLLRRTGCFRGGAKAIT